PPHDRPVGPTFMLKVYFITFLPPAPPSPLRQWFPPSAIPHGSRLPGHAGSGRRRFPRRSGARPDEAPGGRPGQGELRWEPTGWPESNRLLPTPPSANPRFGRKPGPQHRLGSRSPGPFGRPPHPDRRPIRIRLPAWQPRYSRSRCRNRHRSPDLRDEGIAPTGGDTFSWWRGFPCRRPFPDPAISPSPPVSAPATPKRDSP